MFGCNSSCRIVSCKIESAAARVRSQEKIQSARKQFPEHRSAASICARRRLLDKRSNSLCKEIYEGYSFAVPLSSFSSLSLHTLRPLSTQKRSRYFPQLRIHLYTTTCSLRVISYPTGYYNGVRNGNRQMIHEDVKRDVSRQRFAKCSLFKLILIRSS